MGGQGYSVPLDKKGGNQTWQIGLDFRDGQGHECIVILSALIGGLILLCK